MRDLNGVSWRESTHLSTIKAVASTDIFAKFNTCVQAAAPTIRTPVLPPYSRRRVCSACGWGDQVVVGRRSGIGSGARLSHQCPNRVASYLSAKRSRAGLKSAHRSHYSRNLSRAGSFAPVQHLLRASHGNRIAIIETRLVARTSMPSSFPPHVRRLDQAFAVGAARSLTNPISIARIVLCAACGRLCL